MKLLIIFCILIQLVRGQSKFDEFSTLTCPKFIAKLNEKVNSTVKERDYVVADISFVIKVVNYILVSSVIKNRATLDGIKSNLTEIRETWRNLNFSTFLVPPTCVDDSESVSLLCLGLTHKEVVLANHIGNLEHLKNFTKFSLGHLQDLEKLAKDESYATTSNREYSKWKDLAKDIKETVKLVQFYLDAYSYDIDKKMKVEESLVLQSPAIGCIDESQRVNPRNVTAMLFDEDFAINTTTVLYENFFVRMTDNHFLGFSAFLTSNFSLTSFICRCGFGEFHENRSVSDFDAVKSYFNQTESVVDVWTGEKSCVNVSDDDGVVLEELRNCMSDDNGPFEYGVFCRFHEAVVKAFYQNATVWDVERGRFMLSGVDF
jgi:hypothetical protein